ncbi:MAG: 5'-3' exonuclease [Terrimicrobiaceae bacterium]|nr:5'-3' exonuclease [Terrimicrobiaceae bacterium]
MTAADCGHGGPRGMRCLFVDGHYYLYRSFHAIRGLRNSRGEPTNAIFGFAKALRKMLGDLRPGAAAVIWDAGIPERRSSLQPAYKSNRPPMPDDLRPQERWLMENVPLFGPASLSLEGVEADDLIASYARAAERAGHEVVIATNDKDLLQLVSPSVRVYSTAIAEAGGAGFVLLGPKEVEEKWGVPPGLIGEVLALTGDASDNIPGVPGVGEKTAVRLVRSHGRRLLEEIEKVEPPALREKLRAHREQIAGNREMVRLDADLPLPAPIESLAPRPRQSELLAALRACEFRSMLREVEREAAAAGAPTARQGELF